MTGIIIIDRKKQALSGVWFLTLPLVILILLYLKRE